MKQVIEQNFQLDGSPQALPRATEDPVQEFPSQLTEGRFTPLAPLTEKELLRWGAVPRTQQQLRVCRQAGSTLGTTIPQVAEGDPTLDALDQSQRRRAPVGCAAGSWSGRLGLPVASVATLSIPSPPVKPWCTWPPSAARSGWQRQRLRIKKHSLRFFVCLRCLCQRRRIVGFYPLADTAAELRNEEKRG
jgi:hypothetical protein